jgi:peroxiredoxin
MAIAEGKPAPAFTLKDATGKSVSLMDFAGSDVILYFWTGVANAAEHPEQVLEALRAAG